MEAARLADALSHADVPPTRSRKPVQKLMHSHERPAGIDASDDAAHERLDAEKRRGRSAAASSGVTPTVAAEPAMNAAAAGVRTKKKGGGIPARTKVVLPPAIDPEVIEQHPLRQAYRAIEVHDAHELQRILRPAIEEQYPKDEWLKLTKAQLAELEPAFDYFVLGWDVFEREMRGAATLLHIAASLKSIPCMAILLRNGFDIDCGDVDSASALDELAENGYLDGIEFLRMEGADFNHISSSGSTALHTACAEQSVEVVAKLVECGIDLEQRDRDGYTPIMWTLDNLNAQNSIDNCRYLMSVGANANVADKKGGTMLIWALSKVLDSYQEYCIAREDFQPDEIQRAHYELASNRLYIFEYNLTIATIDIDAEATWKAKADNRLHTGPAFKLASDFLHQDQLAQQLLIQTGRAAQARYEKGGSVKIGGRKAQGGQKRKHVKTSEAASEGEQKQDASMTEEASTPMDVSAPIDLPPFPLAPSSSSSVCSTPTRKRATSVTRDDAPKKAKLDEVVEEESKEGSNDDADVEMADVEASASVQPPLSARDSSSTPAPVETKRFIVDESHFQMNRVPSSCKVCVSLYPGETIPETCVRLIFMERLRRATDEGDYGNEERVSELLEERDSDAYPFLKARRLQYHQHDLLPIRVGPLHIASSYEDEGSNGLRILKQLLAAGIEDKSCNSEGMNALQLSSEMGDLHAVDALLHAGFDANETGKTSDGYTPLMLCCDAQQRGGDIAKLLLKRGATLTTRDHFQNTAFQWAVYKGNHGVLTVLLDHLTRHASAVSGTVSHVPMRATTSRQKAKIAESQLKVLTVHDAEVEPLSWQNHWGNAIMHYACYKGFQSEGHFECLHTLLKHGVPIDAPMNRSGLVPRQVVAGFNATHLRGKRVLVLLNSKNHRVVHEPRAKEIEALDATYVPLTNQINGIVGRVDEESQLTPAERALVAKLRKEWKPLNAKRETLLVESRQVLDAELKKLDPKLLELHWAPPVRKRGAGAAAAASSSHGALPSDDAPVKEYPNPYFEDDITRGREWTKIRLENTIDTTGGITYRYITHCLPHPDFQFPLPLAHGVYPAAPTGDTNALTEQQQADRQQREAASKVRERAAALVKQSTKNRKERVAKAPEPKKTGMKDTPASAAKKPNAPAVEPLPRCDCVGPNACQDGSCACFRKYTGQQQYRMGGEEKVLGPSASSAPSSSSAAASGAPAPLKSDAAVSRMAKLATRIEQLCNCHELCGCRLDCANRHIAGGIRVRLAVVKTLSKGWACYADEPIPRGTFICEYVGEIVPPHVASSRLETYDREGVHYVFGFQDSDVCIDPVSFGNVARTINHSCAPNLTKIQIYGSCMRTGKRFPKMSFFAAKDIAKGDELTISYDYENQEHPGGCLVCYCDETTCKHTLV